jgi:hypothetical protein
MPYRQRPSPDSPIIYDLHTSMLYTTRLYQHRTSSLPRSIAFSALSG